MQNDERAKIRKNVEFNVDIFIIQKNLKKLLTNLFFVL